MVVHRKDSGALQFPSADRSGTTNNDQTERSGPKVNMEGTVSADKIHRDYTGAVLHSEIIKESDIGVSPAEIASYNSCVGEKPLILNKDNAEEAVKPVILDKDNAEEDVKPVILGKDNAEEDMKPVILGKDNGEGSLTLPFEVSFEDTKPEIAFEYGIRDNQFLPLAGEFDSEVLDRDMTTTPIKYDNTDISDAVLPLLATNDVSAVDLESGVKLEEPEPDEVVSTARNKRQLDTDDDMYMLTIAPPVENTANKVVTYDWTGNDAAKSAFYSPNGQLHIMPDETCETLPELPSTGQCEPMDHVNSRLTLGKDDTVGVTDNCLQTDCNLSNKIMLQKSQFDSDAKPGVSNHDKALNKKHLTKPIETYTGRIPCIDPHCDEKCNNRKYLRRSAQTHTGDKPFACTHCGIRYSDKSSLIQHMGTHTEKACSCPHCEKSFNGERNLKRHIKLTHKVDKPFPCPHCDRRFNNKSALTIHVRTHTGEKPFPCPQCGKRFSRNHSLKEHQQTHTGGKPFRCGFCEKIYTTKTNLTIHIRTHTGEKPFTCAFCDMKFKDRTALIRHTRTHPGEKLFSCDHCEKKFSLTSNLLRFIKTPDGEKAFVCFHCEQSINEKQNLTRPLQRHTKVEKRFKCTDCDKSFSQPFTWTQHLLTHKGDKNFSCSHCDKKFRFKSEVEKHIRTHTKEKAYHCFHCDKRFNEREGLTRHVVQTHGINWND